MLTEKLCTGRVENITTFIADCHFPPGTLFLAERLPDRVVTRAKDRQALLLFTKFDAHIPFAEYTSGRIFHRDFELRWEQEHGKTQVVYLGTREQRLPSDLIEQDQKLNNCQTRYYYLFGTRLKSEQLERIGVPVEERDFAFAEVRIPRLLLYPVPKDGRQRVRLAVCEYLHETTGKVELFRFQGLETVEDKL